MEHESDSDTCCNWCSFIVTKRVVQGLEDRKIKGRMGTIQTTAQMRSAKILRRFLETSGDFLSLKFQ